MQIDPTSASVANPHWLHGCHPDACEHLSAEEGHGADESLSIYCKPVELYNILQRRAIRNPSFLQRCLHYKIQAKHKRRIQMTVSLSRTVTESQTVFPLYICLARLISDLGVPEYSAVYRISRIFIFRNSPGIDSNTQVQAKFTLPEVIKLAVEARSRSLAVLFVSTVENSNLSSGVNANLMPSDLPSFESRAGEYCLCGKVSLESLYMAWDSSPNFHLGQRAEIMSTVDLLPCILKSDFQNEDTRVSIQVPCNLENVGTSKQVQITISAEEFGAKEKSPYHSFAGSEVASSSLTRIMRLREGNVMFNYRYCNNKLQRTEVATATDPAMIVDQIGHNWPASAHNATATAQPQFKTLHAMNYSCHIMPICSAKPLRRRRPKNLSLKNAKDARQSVLESDFPAGDTNILEKDDGRKGGKESSDTELYPRVYRIQFLLYLTVQ
ncbi:putative polycomb group protein EMBRYONIC FLOWER 2 isoform [Sesbania bispinosa]|nr:putative polycomb group protein EMBRYONIC FLOWER 2 isoform [Sesbania bispinosa]